MAIKYYIEDTYYGQRLASTKGIILMVTQAIFYVLALYMTRKTYPQYVNFDRRIFVSCIWLSSFILLMNCSVHIIYRLSNYFLFFSEILLFALFIKQIYLKTTRNCYQHLILYLFMILCPTLFILRKNCKEDALNPNERFYSNFYPYSSVFDKTIDRNRENIYNYRF